MQRCMMLHEHVAVLTLQGVQEECMLPRCVQRDVSMWSMEVKQVETYPSACSLGVQNYLEMISSLSVTRKDASYTWVVPSIVGLGF